MRAETSFFFNRREVVMGSGMLLQCRGGWTLDDELLLIAVQGFCYNLFFRHLARPLISLLSTLSYEPYNPMFLPSCTIHALNLQLCWKVSRERHATDVDVADEFYSSCPPR